jgi:hypothetical protein
MMKEKKKTNSKMRNQKAPAVGREAVPIPNSMLERERMKAIPLVLHVLRIAYPSRVVVVHSCRRCCMYVFLLCALYIQGPSLEGGG